MGIYSDKAAENFKSGYNCAQSVFLAFSEICGLDTTTALKLSSSFGGGMGKLREVCGAVTALFAIAGILKGYTSPKDDVAKAKHYKLIQTLADKFKQQNGSIICRELLGMEGDNLPPAKRTEQYYKERPCEYFVRCAAEIAEQEFLE